jgi:hypothetical protein
MNIVERGGAAQGRMGAEAGRNTKLLTGEEEGSEGWVDGGFDAFALHG